MNKQSQQINDLVSTNISDTRTLETNGLSYLFYHREDQKLNELGDFSGIFFYCPINGQNVDISSIAYMGACRSFSDVTIPFDDQMYLKSIPNLELYFKIPRSGSTTKDRQHLLNGLVRDYSPSRIFVQ